MEVGEPFAAADPSGLSAPTVTKTSGPAQCPPRRRVLHVGSCCGCRGLWLVHPWHARPRLSGRMRAVGCTELLKIGRLWFQASGSNSRRASLQEEPRSTVHGKARSRRYVEYGYPSIERDLPRQNESGQGAIDHTHDWSGPANSGAPSSGDRGLPRSPQLDPPPQPWLTESHSRRSSCGNRSLKTWRSHGSSLP